MKHALALFSVLFLLVAAYFLWLALSIDPGVPADAPGFAALSDLASVQLMQVQTLNLMIGLAAAILSAILFIGFAVAGIIDRAAADRALDRT